MSESGSSALHALLCVDKPTGCTSHDVVARVRRALGQRRVGHAGTLDPLASGVMVLGCGQATRLLGLLALDVKSYVAEIAFGSETNTDDVEGVVTRTAACPPELMDPERARSLLAGFLGAGEQIPPAFSAISVNGVRSYRLARAGDAVELPARPITVARADALAVFERDGMPVWTVAFEVSKGTYIRALARDIGRAAGGAAHVRALRRTASGSITLERCVTLEGLERGGARAHLLDPLRALGLPALTVSARYREDILCGRRVPFAAASCSQAAESVAGRVALVVDGGLQAIAARRGADIVMDTVFPQAIEGVRP